MRLRGFGPFEMDLDSLELRRDGQPVELQRQPALLLARLIETPGELVSRQELGRRLWPEGVHVVFDHGLDAALHRLRCALGDPAKASCLVETLPGLGVRFVGLVRRRPAGPPIDLQHASQLSDRRTPRAIASAAAIYRSACERAPDEPAPHAGLARTLVLAAEYGLQDAHSGWEGSRHAALQALALNPADVEARAVIAAVQHRYDWNLPAAEASYRLAISKCPDTTTARQGLAELLSQMRRHDEALVEIRSARRIDRVSPILRTVEAWLLFHARRHQDAIACAQEALALDGGFPLARLVLGRSLLLAGRGREALDQLRRAAEDSPGQAWALGALAYAEARLGDHVRVRQRLDELGGCVSSAYFRARVLAALGESAAAWAALGQALQERSGWLTDLGTDPEWDAWRGDARFSALVARVS